MCADNIHASSLMLVIRIFLPEAYPSRHVVPANASSRLLISASCSKARFLSALAAASVHFLSHHSCSSLTRATFVSCISVPSKSIMASGLEDLAVHSGQLVRDARAFAKSALLSQAVWRGR